MYLLLWICLLKLLVLVLSVCDYYVGNGKIRHQVISALGFICYHTYSITYRHVYHVVIQYC